MELGRVFWFGGYGDGNGRRIVEWLLVIAHHATAHEGGLMLCQRCTQLRRVDIVQLAEGVEEGLGVR